MNDTSFSPLADLLRKIMKNAPHSSDSAIWEHWSEVVGAKITRFAKPIRFHDGVLIVGTSNPMWSTELQYRSEELRTKLNQRCQPLQIKQIVFRVQKKPL